MGRKQLARLMILMFYFKFMYGVESRVPSNVNPDLAAGRGVPEVNITKNCIVDCSQSFTMVKHLPLPLTK